MNNKKIKNKSVALATVVLITGSTTFSFAGTGVNKDETVYSILDQNGNVTKNIVSDWISSDSSLGNVRDVSKLTNIKNVKGDEKPTINGEDVTWDVKKDDLYYQGESKESLPIDVNIKYELNGKEVNPKDVVGKKGSFKITLSLKNKESRNVVVNGKNKKIYVPFLTASEIVLNRDNFSDIKTNCGTMLDEGNNAAITFISIPGLKDSLDLSNELNKYLNLKEEVVIEGNTTNFEVPTIMLVATSDVSKYLDDIDSNTSFSDLKSSLDDLQAGGKALVDGASKLSDGANELDTNYKKFNAGVKALDSGITDLNDGASTLVKNLPTLNNGANDLSNGLNTLSSSSSMLSSGAKEVNEGASKLNSSYATLDGGIKGAYEGSTKLKEGATLLETGASDLHDKLGAGGSGLTSLIDSTSKLNSLADSLTAISSALRNVNVSSPSSSNVNNEINSLASRADELGDAALANDIRNLQTNVNTNTTSSPSLSGYADKLDQIAAGIKGIASAQKSGLEALQQGIGAAVEGANSLKNGLTSLKDNLATLETSLGALSNGSSSVSAGLNGLVNGSKQVADGSSALSVGANSAYEGSKVLSQGTEALASGGSQLASGVTSLKNGSSSLSSNSDKILAGMDSLASGSTDLLAGATKLKTEGLDKLSDLGNTLIGSVDDAIAVKDELVNAAKKYDNYSGKNHTMDGSVKFVMKVK